RCDRAFARRTAAEIPASKQNGRLRETRLVEHAILVRRAVRQVAQRLERMAPQVGAAGQPLNTDDDVGVDIGAQQGRGGSSNAGEWTHGSKLSRVEQLTGYRGGNGHGRTCEMRARTRPLATDEIAI